MAPIWGGGHSPSPRVAKEHTHLKAHDILRGAALNACRVWLGKPPQKQALNNGVRLDFVLFVSGFFRRSNSSINQLLGTHVESP